tara:strand:- start:1756 stop:2283 length:528 start_codon:yes stop_codon:yes gene_type:complete
MGTKRVGLARTQALIENLKRELTMGGAKTQAFQASQPQKQTYTFKWEYGTDTATVAEHNLKDPLGNALSLPVGFMVTGGWLEVIDAVTSGGAATLIVGTGTTATGADPNGFVTSIGKASLTANSVHPFDGALAHNTTAAGKRIVTTVAPVSITIGSAALTAGKFYVYVEGYQDLG